MIARVVLVLVAALALAGCSDPESDEVRSVVRQYLQAYAAGDAAKVCSLLTPEARGATAEGGCEAQVQRSIDRLDARERERLRTLRAGDVAIAGDRADVKLDRQAGGERGELRKVDGRWLIDAR